MARYDVQRERVRYKRIRRVLGWTTGIAFVWWLWNGDVTVGLSTPWGFSLSLPLLLWFFSAIGLFVYLRFLASFDCPYCEKVVDLNTDWECYHCHRIHRNPIWYTIFHRCSHLKCRKKPKYWECANCKNVIYLLSPAPQLKEYHASQLPSAEQSNVAHFPRKP